MKKESLQRMKDLIAMIQNDELLATYPWIAEQLNAVVRMETKDPTMKLDLMDYASIDPIRPMMSGIYHEGGYKIATDSYVLAMVKSEYEPSLEKVVVSRDGSLLTEEKTGIKYPNYKSILPSKDRLTNGIKVSVRDWKDLYKVYRADKKLGLANKDEHLNLLKLGDEHFVRMDWMHKFMIFVGEFECSIYLLPYGQIYATDGTNHIVLMCTLKQEDSKIYTL